MTSVAAPISRLFFSSWCRYQSASGGAGSNGAGAGQGGGVSSASFAARGSGRALLSSENARAISESRTSDAHTPMARAIPSQSRPVRVRCATMIPSSSAIWLSAVTRCRAATSRCTLTTHISPGAVDDERPRRKSASDRSLAAQAGRPSQTMAGGCASKVGPIVPMAGPLADPQKTPRGPFPPHGALLPLRRPPRPHPMPGLSRLFELIRDPDGGQRLRLGMDGVSLLRFSLTNRGTAFPYEERVALGLDGLLPPAVTPLDWQIERSYAAFLAEPTALAKYSFLRGLQERNEVLYYALLEQHIAEMLPIIYTPTVGDAVMNASRIYRWPRGVSLSLQNIDRAGQVFNNCVLDDVRIVVATDSSAILGIGDQGWGGVSIAIGKLALYTAGGVSPYRSLPVVLDVGTDRGDLLKSDGYLGHRTRRLRGADYHAFMDKVVAALAARWPRVVLQWEDLSKDTAFDVLERYRKKIASFNDDIQRTGAVTLARLLVAGAARGRRVRDESVIVYGAGAGGVGVAWAIEQGMLRDGLSVAESRARLFVIDSKGLLVEGRAMEDYKKPFAQPRERVAGWGGGAFGLLDTIEKGKATVLLGLSGQPGAFTEPMLRAICVPTEHPVVFPLSNPTRSCEAQPADLLAW